MREAAEERRRHDPDVLLAHAPADAVISVRGLTKEYDGLDRPGRRPSDARRPPGRGLRAPGPEWRRQDDDGPDAPRPHGADEWQGPVLGLDPTRNPLHVKRHVGYLPDSVGFYGNLTGRENLRYTARLNGIPRRDADLRIGDVLGQVRLASRADDRTEAIRAACASASASPTRWSRTPRS